MRSKLFGSTIRVNFYGSGKKLPNYVTIHQIIRHQIHQKLGNDPGFYNFVIRTWELLGPAIFIGNKLNIDEPLYDIKKLWTKGLVDCEDNRIQKDYYNFETIFPLEYEKGNLICHIELMIEGVLIDFDAPKRLVGSDDCPIPKKIRIIE
ncbi:beta [New Kent County virus]|uniref:Beta n=1 Tax=New Kent County virus TaxID=2079603 RepID=A0A2K9YNH9_9RHAB|nr:beta [New Kent County virus]AUW34403.1 beta [New Kent County virus]